MAEKKGLATRGAGAEAIKVAGAITSMGIDELIFNMAKGIADGQARLDETCMDLAIQMGDAQIEFGKIAGTNEPDVISLIELGFTPNFYQFVDTILEVRLSVSSQYEEEQEESTSELDRQVDEKASQQQYASQRSSAYSGETTSYSQRFGIDYGRGRFGISRGASVSSRRYAGSSSTGYRRGSTEKSKAVKVNTVDATFASKYAYSVEASSLIKTKIVPIPPPQVLEEAVQSKAKERKEWAKRFALLRFSKNLLPAIADSGSDTAKQIEAYLELKDVSDTVTQSSSAPDYTSVVEIKFSLESLNEEYERLTNDHWSVIENVKDRRILDNNFENLTKSASSLMSYYDETGKKLLTGADKDALNAELNASHTDLNSLKAKIDEIMERLPLTPEEMAREEEEAANQ